MYWIPACAGMTNTILCNAAARADIGFDCLDAKALACTAQLAVG